MKVLLISANTARSPYPVYPIGISMVAAALRQAGHEVCLFDCLQHEQTLEALSALLRAEPPALVGISIRNIDNVNLLHEERYIDGVRLLVERIRAETKARIVLGGSGFSLMPDAILEAVGADYGVVGEGEGVFTAFVTAAAKGNYPRERLLYAGARLSGAAIPSAHYDANLVQFYLRSGTIGSVQTKRGCPHACLYCSYPLLEGARIRPRLPAAVADDVETLVTKVGAKYVFFTDSVFNDDQGHYLDVVRELKRRGLCVPWTAFFKPDGLTPEAVALMKETGLKAAEIGADAATDTTLKALGKGFTWAEVTACNNLFLDNGIPTAHYFMFGGPGETPETVAESIANIKAMRKSAIFVFMGIRILPGTGLVKIALAEGLLAPGQELLTPVYYISPRVDRAWLEKTLTEGFAGLRHVVFPPDAINSTLTFLHSLGYTGALWDLLTAEPTGRRRRGRTGTE